MKFLLAIVFILYYCPSTAQHLTAFEASNGTKTATYEEVISYYEMLARLSNDVKILEMGSSDSGKPLHLVLYDQEGEFDTAKWKDKEKLVILINNGIHPGEPAGIDASMLLLKDLINKEISLPNDIVLAIIPIYNIGGHLNRNSTTRVNQNGPEEYGFRGNARNYDLNRDFIKADTKNARSFQEIFHFLDPHIFIDTHTSNGADYQHVMTLIPTQHNKLGGELGNYLQKDMIPYLFSEMEKSGYPMVPYVNAWNGSPENGWTQFKDSPRYSSGYAALFHVLSFMPEAHMLKSYQERVNSMKILLKIFLKAAEIDDEKIRTMRNKDREQDKSRSKYEFNHHVDKDTFSEISFHGYKSGYKPSEVSGKERLYYDQAQPFETIVKYYDNFTTGLLIDKPSAYVIPKGWFNIIDHLKRNGVSLIPLKNDSLIKVTAYQIVDFETSPQPFEGHYLHSKVEVTKVTKEMMFHAGDFILPMNQVGNRFVMEVLEPEAEDSFFAWNYFDTVLQAKEGYSPYVFEDLAALFLEENPEIRTELESKKRDDAAFAEDGPAQLRWVFERSPWKEKAHQQYPIFRIER